MEEEEALTNYCRRVISVVRRKQLKCGSSVLGRRERENQTTSVRTSAECRLRTVEAESSKVAAVSGIRRTPFRPEAQPVPAQLIAMLRLKTAQENISRAAEVELHDPAACCECEQEQACVALKGFIRRKKTQLQFHTLNERLNMHSRHAGALPRLLCSSTLTIPGVTGASLAQGFVQDLSEPFGDAPRRIREELLSRHMRVTATWGCLRNGERTRSCPGNR